MKRKLNDRQVEKLMHAMDYIQSVKRELEEEDKGARIRQNLDKCIGIMYEQIHH